MEQGGLALEQSAIEPLGEGNQRNVVFDQKNQIENVVKTRFVQQRTRNHALKWIRSVLRLSSAEKKRERLERGVGDTQTRDEKVVIATHCETNNLFGVIVLLLLVIETDQENEEIIEYKSRTSYKFGVVSCLVLL